MNIKLKKIIKKHIDHNEEFTLFIDKEQIEKYNSMNEHKFTSKAKYFEDPLSPYYGGAYITIAELYNENTYRYFDLIDGTNHLVYNPEAYLKPMNGTIKNEFLKKWSTDKEIDRVVISHKGCNDGYGVNAITQFNFIAKLALNGVSKEIEYIMLDYNTYDFNEVLEQVKGKIVYVGDFSFEQNEYDRLINVADIIVTVDHHLGAFNSEISSYNNTHIDMTYSGTMLAWKFFMDDMYNIPLAIKLIEDRDLWNFFYGDLSKAFTLMIKREKSSVINKYLYQSLRESKYESAKLINFAFDDKLKNNLKPYIRELEALEEDYLARAKTAKPYMFNGETIHGLNIRNGVSEILNHVSRIFGTASFAYWEDENGLFQLSFRDATDNNDVNMLAKIYGGGGHKAASGSRLNFTDLNLHSFFVDKRMVVEYEVKSDDISTMLFFATHGISVIDYVNSAHCEGICKKLETTFDKLFVVTRDEKQNLILTITK